MFHINHLLIIKNVLINQNLLFLMLSYHWDLQVKCSLVLHITLTSGFKSRCTTPLSCINATV